MKGKPSPYPASELLENKYVVSLLMYIGDRGKCRKIDLFEDVSQDPMVAERILLLEGMGLLEQNPEPGSRSNVLNLTPDGRAIYRLLLEIDDVVRNR